MGLHVMNKSVNRTVVIMEYVKMALVIVMMDGVVSFAIYYHASTNAGLMEYVNLENAFAI